MCGISAACDHSLKVLWSTKERALGFALIVESSGWDVCLEAKSILPVALLYNVKEPGMMNDILVLLLSGGTVCEVVFCSSGAWRGL